MTPTNISRANTDTWSKDSSLSPNEGENQGESEICPICKGAGFVHPLLDSGQPDFSRVVPCRCRQGRLQKEKLGYLEKYSNLGSLSRFTFDNLSPLGKPARHSEGAKQSKNLTQDKLREESQKHLASVYQAARTFADNPGGWLMLLGPSGCGKTHLSCAIANHRLNLGEPAFYISVADLLDHLRTAFNPTNNITYDELFEQVKNVPLLVLDDLTPESATPWAKEKIEQLFNYRYNTKLATVITTDVPLGKLDERLRAKLGDSEFCQVCVISPISYEEAEQSPLQLELLRNMTFDNFDCKRLNLSLEQRQNLQQAFKLASDFAHSPDGWLIFQGINGCGKTHLAAAIANYRRAQGEPVFFVVVTDLLDHLRSTFSPESKISYDEFFEKIKTSPVLVLDDFGEQAATPWAQEKLYQLINYRYNAKLPTVVTTCLSPDEVEPRIGSRMVDPRLSVMFNITTPDYRGDIKPRRRTNIPQERYS